MTWHTVDLLFALKIKVGCLYILPEKLTCRMQITRHKYLCTPLFFMLTDPGACFQFSGYRQKDNQLETGSRSVYF